jgi:glutamine amidotransferase
VIDVAVIDAGGANLGSVRYAVERLGASVRVVRDADDLRGAARVILPGVGAAAPAMAALQARGLDDAVASLTVPLLGICLGMQLLFESSEEGAVQCLGLIPGTVRRMHAAASTRVPHMGWNTLQDVRRDMPLLDGIDEGAQAYFVHSYAVAVGDDCIASAQHGDRFAAVVQRGQVAGTQFHPERSGAVGARVLANFLAGVGA